MPPSHLAFSLAQQVNTDRIFKELVGDSLTDKTVRVRMTFSEGRSTAGKVLSDGPSEEVAEEMFTHLKDFISRIMPDSVSGQAILELTVK